MSYAERADRFDADLAAAAAADDSDSQLVALLSRPSADDRERILIAAALGESGTGPDGSAAVRAQFSDAMTALTTATKSARSGWRDLVCAAVIALARRDGPAATDIYLAAAASASADVRDYGLMVLAAEGDDRAWDPVLATVSEILGRKRISYGRWYDMLHAPVPGPACCPRHRPHRTADLPAARQLEHACPPAREAGQSRAKRRVRDADSHTARRAVAGHPA
jgi:hypothetical protein